MLAELKKSVNGVISDGRKKRSFAEVHIYTTCVYECVHVSTYTHAYLCTICNYVTCMHIYNYTCV